MRHIIASDSVAPCGSANQAAIFIQQGNGDAIDFRFDCEVDGPSLGELANAGHELAQFFWRIGVVEALHRHDVRGGGELLERLATHPAGG